MENKKLSYWKWLQKDTLLAFILITWLAGAALYYAPAGSYPWLGYSVSVLFMGLDVVIVVMNVKDWIKYKKSDD